MKKTKANAVVQNKETEAGIKRVRSSYSKFIDISNTSNDPFEILLAPDSLSEDVLVHEDFLNEIRVNNIYTLDFSPENIHFISRTIFDNRISVLHIFDHEEFFKHPLLVHTVRKALSKFDYTIFYISFPRLYNFFVRNDLFDLIDENLFDFLELSEHLFKQVEILNALEQFNRSSEFTIDILDLLYDCVVKDEPQISGFNYDDDDYFSEKEDY